MHNVQLVAPAVQVHYKARSTFGADLCGIVRASTRIKRRGDRMRSSLSISCERLKTAQQINRCGLVQTAIRRAATITLVFFANHAVTAAEPPDKAVTSEESTGLQEVVVTARYVTENLQRTPVAITALTGDDLDARGMNNIGDLGNSAPSVTLQSSFGGFGKSVVAAIRGIGQYDFLPAFEPGVGIYIDDVYHGTLYGALLELGDVDRVEILRGPQGTLFGKNNEGGAVRVFSRKPTGDGGGYLQAGYGSFDRMLVKGAFETTIIPDKLFVRLSGGVNRYDGHMKQYDFVCAHPTLAGNLPRVSTDPGCKVGTLGGDNASALRAAVKWVASETVQVDINADVLVDKGEPTADKLVALANPTTHPGSLLNILNPGLVANPAYGVPIDDRFITDNLHSTYVTYNNVDNGHTFPKVSNLTSWGTGITTTWDAPAGLHVTNILGYRSYSGEFIESWFAGPIHANDNYYKPYHHQFSEELRLSGALMANRLEWTVGGYYYSSLTELNDFVDLPVLFGYNFYGVDPVKDYDRSGFLHGVYHVTDKFAVEVGGRYSNLSKQYTFNRYILVPYTLPPPIGPGVPFAVVQPGFENNPAVTSRASHVDKRLALQYQWTERLMTYVQFATGFKGGGVNPRPIIRGDLTSFQPETLKSYEVGAKTQWFDNRLRANLAAYFSDYKDLQLNTITPGSASSTVTNTGEAHIYGFEGEFTLEPVDQLRLNASVGYLHYKNTNLGTAAGFPGGPTLDSVPPYTPKWKVNAGGQYAFTLGGNGTLTARFDYTYQTKTFNDLVNSDEAASAGYGLLAAHLTYASPDESWAFLIEVQNVANKEYYINKFNQLDGAGVLSGQPGLPRTWLASMRRNF